MTEFERIYRAYFDDVYRYIRGLSGDEALAEEITSETFFKVMHSIDGFRGDCDIRVWLCQIAKNGYFTHRKRAGRTQNVEEALLSLPAPDETEERWMQREDAARIRSELHRLPEPYKEVFLWRVLGELSFRQIGQMFGKTENWACVTYHRAKAKIRSGLEDEKE